MSDDGRVRDLRDLVRAAGAGSDASVAGAHGDIAVIHGARPEAVTSIADRIRGLGFRHVTVDLASIPLERDA